jgi:hypothetical protein
MHLALGRVLQANSCYRRYVLRPPIEGGPCQLSHPSQAAAWSHPCVARNPPGAGSEFKMEPMSLARSNGLGYSDRKTVSAIGGNSTVDKGTTIDAFPGIKHEKEIREPL